MVHTVLQCWQTVKKRYKPTSLTNHLPHEVKKETQRPKTNKKREKNVKSHVSVYNINIIKSAHSALVVGIYATNSRLHLLL